MNYLEELSEAFHLGVTGMPFEQDQVSDYTAVLSDEPQLEIEETFQSLGFTPIFADAASAYEAGRCLRMIGYLLDRSGVGLEPARRWAECMRGSPPASGSGCIASYWDKNAICSVLGRIGKLRKSQIEAMCLSALSYSKDRPAHQVFTAFKVGPR